MDMPPAPPEWDEPRDAGLGGASEPHWDAELMEEMRAARGSTRPAGLPLAKRDLIFQSVAKDVAPVARIEWGNALLPPSPPPSDASLFACEHWAFQGDWLVGKDPVREARLSQLAAEVHRGIRQDLLEAYAADEQQVRMAL